MASAPSDIYDLLQNLEQKLWLTGLLWDACQDNHITSTSASTSDSTMFIPPELAVVQRYSSTSYIM